MSHVKYVIRDTKRGGYAVDDPIEGWIFTILVIAATTFDNHEDAETAMKQNFPGERHMEVRRTLVYE